MFIIEGSDSLGKTTLANKIVEHVNEVGMFPARYVHMTRPPKSFNFDSHYEDLMSYFGVQDRFHLGARAYHNDVLSDASLKWIEGELLRRASYIVVLVAPDEEWYRAKIEEEKRDQMFNIDILMNANRRFIEMANWDTPNSVYHDDVFEVGPPFADEVRYPNDAKVKEWAGFWMNRVVAALGRGSRLE